eukprot:TRINITY_DN12704_c0_g1_i1.p1 TRINITY_DN12704_c0_g1~~TRINITY_DN12704_c0_g1_i1.p1  ORF type:complete len:538 (-),score=77.35 TRINITY_DN12704_c0_g1_i1:62-1675(-)
MTKLHPTNDLGEHRLQTISKHEAIPHWSFGTGTRFKWEAKATKRLTRSFSLPSTPQGTAGADEDTAGGGIDEEEEEEEWEEDGDEEAEAPQPPFERLGWSVGGGVSRLDGGSDRFIDHPQRVSSPRPKQYEPASAMGEDTSSSMIKAPSWSFGGGNTRMPEEKRVLPTSGRPIPKPKNRGAMLPEGPMQRELAKFKKMTKGPSRGFGSEMRLPIRGGSMQLAMSPGPAAYEVPRDNDLAPQWSVSTLTPWGKRTGGRPACLNATATDAGPGEYTADHEMQSNRPGCKFGQPLQKLKQFETPDPGRYDVPSTIGVAPKFSIGAGNRGTLSRANDGPGPGAYDPNVNVVQKDSYCTTFGRAARAHPADDVDADEPPGPGAHDVRAFHSKPQENPSAGWPMEQKLKSPPGMGPKTPGPVYDIPSGLSKRGTSLAGRFVRTQEVLPSPTDYDPMSSLTTPASPSWGSPARTAPRRGFWESYGTGDEARGSKLKPAPIDFKPQGARWTMAPRRPLQHGGGGAKPKRNNNDLLYGGFYSTEKP